MPSAFTHVITGAAISVVAPQPYRGLELAAVLGAAAAMPDVDVLAFRLGIPYGHPLGHRGLTHSLPFAFVTVAAIWIWFKRRGPLASWASAGLFGVAFVACASHGFLDAFTDAGLGVGFFVPFDERRYFFPWRPVLTSPVSVSEFFAGRGLAILRNEITYIWLPVALVAALVLATRRLRERRRA